MHEYDKSSKWLIQHFGDSILRLGGIDDVVSWRPLQAEVVQPRQLPDGLIEVMRRGATEPDLFIVEVATYPESRVIEQVVRDATLVYLDRRVLPDCLVVVLSRKGKPRALDSAKLLSRTGATKLSLKWRCVELWNVEAEELFGTGEVGLVPWIPLSHSDQAPEALISRCAERIRDASSPEETENLLAVTQVLARLRYNDLGLLGLLGGKQAMIESPLIDEIVAVARHRDLLRILARRFGEGAQRFATRLEPIEDPGSLDLLIDHSATCPDLDSFGTLLDNLPPPKPRHFEED